MLRLQNIAIPLDYTNDTLKAEAAKKLKIPVSQITNISLNKRSVDARKKNDVHFICSLDVTVKKEEKKLQDACKRFVVSTTPYHYHLPEHRSLRTQPVIIGSGPSGLFSALILAQAGQNPIIVERGYDVDTRVKVVSEFWSSGKLDETSNVQFGEGGAGTFSDGKLNTGTKDPRSKKVLKEFVLAGAPEEILYLTKPHIGTDKLRPTVKNLRKKIESLGGTFLFGTKLIDFIIKDHKIKGVLLQTDSTEFTIDTDSVILAIGHSARDTFSMLLKRNIPLEPKAFSVGARIEHLQEKISKRQYGSFWNHPSLGAADYKLAVHLKNGRGVYTFCMCPGGQVVASSSEKDTVVTNGMSEYSRSCKNANSALLVGITPDDFGSQHPLAGMQLQQSLERKAFLLGGSNYYAPIQRVEDFLNGRITSHLGEVSPSYLPGVNFSNLSDCLPEFVTESMQMGILEMDQKLPGFYDPDAVLTGVETRSSSPIRILRNERCESILISGLYPCGEGAGYAGGIISAAVDGIRCAEHLLKSSIAKNALS